MLNQHARRILSDRYTLEGEQPEGIFKRVAFAYGSTLEHSERLLSYMEKLWFIPATPILTNGGTSPRRGEPISCFLNMVPDSREGISDHIAETLWMSTNGGGVGADWSALRSVGTSTSTGSETTGLMAYLAIMDRVSRAANQGKTRRGGYCSYMYVGHPEIKEYLAMRNKSGGDINRKNFNLHHAVNIPDAFMRAVESDSDWELIDPHTKEVKEVLKARELWHLILDARDDDGEPFLHFIDRSNEHLHPDLKEQGLEVRGSNLCVAPETLVLTDKGWFPIESLAGQQVNIWNGIEFSKSQVAQTSAAAELLTVTFSNGTVLECTPEHVFHLQDGFRSGTGKNKLRRYSKAAKDLVPGDRLEKWDLPIIYEGEELPEAYTQGVFSGDGCSYKGKNHIDLYACKKDLPVKGKQGGLQIQDRIRVSIDRSYQKFYVPINGSLTTKLQWLAGLLDSDGTAVLNGDTPGMQIGSIHLDFLNKVKLMLQSMGINSKVTKMVEAGPRLLPDGKGSKAFYECQDGYRLLIGATGVLKLKQFGICTYRLSFKEHTPNRNSEHFVTVRSVVRSGRISPTFCFNEPKRHRGMFNGILAGNCTEITLPTGPDYSAVCCLSSVNLDTFHEWEQDKRFIGDVVEMLDNVLQDFIDNGPDYLANARRSAEWERSIGLGAMGLHSFLQRNLVPFSSPAARGWNRRIFSHLKSYCVEANHRLAKTRGPAKGLKTDRFAHMIAIAPNASTSVIAGVSPSIEPWNSNLFVQNTLSGSLVTRNPHLNTLLQNRLGDLAQEAWDKILDDEGSVQNLDCLTDHEKDVFKSAWEIDQRSVVEQAADRQQYICQAQSVNLFFPSGKNRGYYNRVHRLAWERGMKTLYYSRTTPVRSMEKVTYNAKSACVGGACEG